MEGDNNSRIKLCKVCGDYALGFNFNGLSCVSCKAFFRRSALREPKNACRNGGQCKIDRFCRIRCKPCRLNKCFQIGMKKELISLRGKDPGENRNFENNLCNDNRISLYKEDWTRKPNSNSNNITPLNLHEVQLLYGLHHAMSLFPNDSAAQVTGLCKSIFEFYNIPGSHIQKVIKFCKSFNGFAVLKQDDQLMLLKSFYTDISLVRYSFQYQLQHDGFPIIYNEDENKAIFVKWDIYREWSKADIVRAMRSYHYAMYREMENDVNIRNLIIALLLFKIQPENLSCFEYLRYQYHIYDNLLQRYLEHKYNNTAEAKLKHSSILHVVGNISTITGQALEIYRSFKGMKPNNILREIYDIV